MTLAGIFAGVLQQQGAGGGPFHPTDLAWSHLFLAETALATYGDTGTVTTWEDLGSEGTDATSSGSPTVSATTMNGSPGVVLGASQYFTFGPGATLTTPVTVWAVIRIDSAAGGGTNQFAFDSDTGRGTVFFGNTGNAYNINNGGTTQTAGTWSTGTVFEMVTVFDATDSVSVNGSTVVSGNAGTNSIGTSFMIGINRTLALTADLNGTIGAIGWFDGTLSAGNLSDLSAWAADYKP